jgi:hypothetical protein
MRTPSSMPLPIILKGRNMPHSGNCFCGTVKLEVTGSPEAVGLATTVTLFSGIETYA